MSSLDQFTGAFEQLKRGWAEQRLAHAYLIGGSPSGAGLALVQSLLKLLYCEGAEKPCGVCAACHRVERRQQPDITWLEPEKKSRIISVDQIRELNRTLAQTAFSGGWKAGVILACDRLKEEGANAFLKTLEEPPGQTLLLLVTDQMQAMMPTIVSRCQRVVLDEKEEEPAWRPALLAILARHETDAGLDTLLMAGRLKGLLDEVKVGLQNQEEEKESGDEESREVSLARVQAKLIKERTEMLRAVQFWQRDLLACRLGAGPETLHFRDQAAILQKLARGMSVSRLLERVEAVERIVRLTEVNVADLVAIESSLLATRPVTPVR